MRSALETRQAFPETGRCHRPAVSVVGVPAGITLDEEVDDTAGVDIPDATALLRGDEERTVGEEGDPPAPDATRSPWRAGH